MDNIFTLNKNSVFLDDTEPESINIDDLYEKKRERDMSQLRLFNKMLSRVHARIKLTSRQANAEKMCWFVVPEFILGIPLYNQGDCIGYIMDKLKQDGFRIQYIHPNALLISWNHWVPNYVLAEIKEKTGKVYDNNGNDLTPSPMDDKETNQKYDMTNKTQVELKHKNEYSSENEKIRVNTHQLTNTSQRDHLYSMRSFLFNSNKR